MHPRREDDALFVCVIAHIRDHFGAKVFKGALNLRQVTLVVVCKSIHFFFKCLL